MNVIYTEPFKKDFEDLSPAVRRALDKALKFLLENLRYPSLRARKLPGTFIWYARITKAYRFTFQLEDEMIILRRAGTHDILNEERRQK